MNKIAAILLVFAWITPARAQKQFNVLDWKSGQTVNTYLLSVMQQQYEERERNLAQALKSTEGIKAYRDSCKARYRELIGLLPERTSLQVKQTGRIQQAGYHIEKIIYESIPHHHVTANLYVPSGQGPFPGVLLFCGHEDNAKATVSYQKTAILFAQHGFVVLVIDPISQAERHQLTDDTGNPLTRGGTTEHTLVNAAANLVGSGAVAYQLWDNIRGLDYLVSRKEVDKERIGCLGNSGGGTQTTYFIGYDDRIKVAAPCSYIARRERNFELTGANDGCQHLPFEGQAQLEISDYLIMFAPKPLLILSGRYDFVEHKGTNLAYQEVKNVYTALGVSERVKLFTADDGHGISKPKREAAVSWFRKWLYNDERPVEEGDNEALHEEALTVTRNGQVNATYKDEVNDILRTRRQADALRDMRNNGSVPLRARVLHVLKITNNLHSIEAEHVGDITQANRVVNKMIVRREQHMPIPVLTVFPKDPIKEVIVWFWGSGKHVVADSVSLLDRYMKEQKAVVLADISGVGELADPLSANDPKYYNREYRNAMLGLHTGHSLPALRTRDIINVLDFIASAERMKDVPIRVYASGICAIPALHAAVLDDRIMTLFIGSSIPSFYTILDNPLQKDHYSNVIPGVLKYYDIPEIKASLGDRLKEQ